MPFITLTEFKEIVQPDAETVFFAQGETHFNAVEAQAAEIIAEKTGISNPVDVADAPKWAKTPAAWIIYFISLTRNTGLRAEDITHGEKLYDRAMELLSQHREKAVPNATFHVGEIEELEGW